ncbi:hypothetical protein KKH81_00965 [Patescibacteria group bacterium]|nr:hypothetical protein [Patescibacteria group bacterium]
MSQRLKDFKYIYDKGAGPLSEVELAEEKFEIGNCRLAIQYFLYKTKGLFIPREEILLPKGYRDTGVFVYKEEPIDFDTLEKGDIIYAENLRNKKGELREKKREMFETEDEWILYFHTAVYLGRLDAELREILPEGDYPESVPLIWHSTFIEGGTCAWPLEKFEYFYKPVSIKRVQRV